MSAALVLLVLLFGSAEARSLRNDPTPHCDDQSSVRLTLVNNCANALWAVITAPGANQAISVRAQWDWLSASVMLQRNTIGTGWTGSISPGGDGTRLTIKTDPVHPSGFEFFEGMKILIIGAGRSGGNLTTTISRKSDNILTLKDRGAQVQDAALWYYNDQNAFQVGAGATQGLCVPKKGAPGGNFRFFMGCPNLESDTGPFGTPPGSTNCVIGSSFGDAASVNTLFEPSFGCMAGTSPCAFNPSDPGDCQTHPSATTCGPLSGTDFFDISAVDGYTFPMKVEAKVEAPGECDHIEGKPPKLTSVKDASMLDLASCPTETKETIIAKNADGSPGAQQDQINGGVSLVTQDGNYLQSCAAPHTWFSSTQLGTPNNPTLTLPTCTADECNSVAYYAAAGCAGGGTNAQHCPAGSGPQQKVGPNGDGTLAIQNTNFVQQLRALGYTGYTWQYDDGVGTQTCTAGATIKVTLCPAGGAIKPYLKNPLWTFEASTGECRTDGSAGVPDNDTTFGSLFACQTAKMRYICTDLTDTDPFKLPIGVWAANAEATRNPTAASRTYQDFRKQQGLICEDTPDLKIPKSSNFVGADHLSVRNCTYYAEPDPDAKERKICPVQ